MDFNPYKKYGVMSDIGEPIELGFDYEVVASDWKDIEGLIEGMKKACAKYGVYIYDHPGFEGTDMFGLVVINKQLNEKDLKRLDEKEYRERTEE